LGFLLREPVQDVGVGEAHGAGVEDGGHDWECVRVYRCFAVGGVTRSMRYECRSVFIAEVEVRWRWMLFRARVRSSEARVLSIFSKGCCCNAGRRGGANAGTVKADQIRTLYFHFTWLHLDYISTLNQCS
jgi:hypothetical protein